MKILEARFFGIEVLIPGKIEAFICKKKRTIIFRFVKNDPCQTEKIRYFGNVSDKSINDIDTINRRMAERLAEVDRPQRNKH